MGRLGTFLVSVMVWGLAHLRHGWRKTGGALLALEIALAVLAALAATVWRPRLVELLVQPVWLNGLVAVLAVTGVAWAAVIVTSYLLVRPAGAGRVERGLEIAGVVALCAAVAVPLAYAADIAQVSKGVVTEVFAAPTREEDPWADRPRISILLVGADAAENRVGVRTDSMTVASIDTHTGQTVLFSLPRNLEDVPMPTAASRAAFPHGFQGDGTVNTPGLLNEVYQWAEEHPEIVPGVPAKRRGPSLLKDTVAGILGLHVDYYAMVDMKGFAQIIDAVGGVRVHISEDLVYGRYNEGLIKAGTRVLSGNDALWFGRTRTNSSDYARMSRQKCLLYALREQADPWTVLVSFRKLASAAKRAVATDIPQNLLPGLISLSQRTKGVEVKSVQFVPPLISTAYPDWKLIKDRVQEALAPAPAPASPDVLDRPTPTPTTPSPARTPRTPRPDGSPDPTETAHAEQDLTKTCR